MAASDVGRGKGRELSLLEVPVLTPSEEEFRNIENYVRNLFKMYANELPFVKIRPPAGYCARPSGFVKMMQNFIPYTQKCRQHATEKRAFLYSRHKGKSTTFEKFRDDNSAHFMHTDEDFWTGLANRTPKYVDGISHTYFEKQQCAWNMADCIGLLQHVKSSDRIVNGVTSPYCYIAQNYSFFPFHCEDYFLLSFSFCLLGGEKIWYGIPAAYYKEVEEIIRKLYPEEMASCDNWIMHKEIMIHPSVFLEAGIQVYKLIQRQGEFVLTFPRGSHWGWNGQFSVAEAGNIAVPEWVPFARFYDPCSCEDKNKKSTVLKFTDDEFSNFFMRTGCPEQYKEWLKHKKLTLRWDSAPGYERVHTQVSSESTHGCQGIPTKSNAESIQRNLTKDPHTSLGNRTTESCPEGRSVYSCSHMGCARTFMTTSGRYKHYQSKHMPTVTCERCGKTYANMNTLGAHQRIHPECKL